MEKRKGLELQEFNNEGREDLLAAVWSLVLEEQRGTRGVEVN